MGKMSSIKQACITAVCIALAYVLPVLIVTLERARIIPKRYPKSAKAV